MIRLQNAFTGVLDERPALIAQHSPSV